MDLDPALVGLLGVLVGAALEMLRERIQWHRQKALRVEERADRERAELMALDDRTRERFHQTRLETYARFIEAIRALSGAHADAAGAFARQNWASQRESTSLEEAEAARLEVLRTTAASMTAGEQVSLALNGIALVASDNVYARATELQQAISDSFQPRLQMYIDRSSPSTIELYEAWQAAQAATERAQEAFRVAVREETQGR